VAFGVGTVVVVTGEEVLIRGALWQACTRALGGAAGDWLAVVLGAAAFALIHVPWYGWGVLPLDLAAGLWLGALRLGTDGLTAPWIAHAGADLGTWWLL
jgi:membrane protease YdiL (CAAX protease family)